MKFPKPETKKRRAKSNPRPTGQDWCVICGKPYAELHEVFGGKNRQASIKYNMQIRLCGYHHRYGEHAIHKDKEFRQQVQARYQQKFEKIYGHEKFMQVFGRNYIRDEATQNEAAS